jgi:2-hydroxychromene-2-carboxylate isomerase
VCCDGRFDRSGRKENAPTRRCWRDVCFERATRVRGSPTAGPCDGGAERGSGTAFALAAARLAYCGGFDLEDPEILAEAAAAAGMKLDACLAAAGDPSWDGDLLATARGLLSRGVRELPAVRVATRFIAGERGLPEAAAMLRACSRPRRVAPLP